MGDDEHGDERRHDARANGSGTHESSLEFENEGVTDGDGWKLCAVSRSSVNHKYANTA
jgi:hypothetical protein